MGGERARRVRRPWPDRLGRRLAALSISCALALAGAAQGVTPGGRELHAEVLAYLRDPGLAPGALEARLEELLAAIPPPASLDDLGRRAWLAARLAVALDSEEELADLQPAWSTLARDDQRAWTVYEVGNAHLVAGRAREAAAAARYGLERLVRVSTIEPRLWHLALEAARLLGQWEELDRSLAAMGASLAPESAARTALDREFRSRWLQARAQVLQDLGLLDVSRPLVDEAVREARASGEPSALLAARLLELDQALLRGDEESALAAARAGLADPLLVSARAKFRVAEGVIHVERVRDALARGADATPVADAARAAFTEARAGATVLERLKAELWSADLESMLGRRDSADAALARARELARELGPSLPVNEDVLLALLAWRAARLGAVDPPKRAAARAELLEAYAKLLAHWASALHRPGGIGFLHLSWRAQVVSEVLAAELERGGPERAFLRLLEVQSMGSVARERGLAPVTLAQARELLAPGRGLLVLLPARDEGRLFLLDDEGLLHARIPDGRSALRERAEELTSALANPAGVVAPAAVWVLHDRLLPAPVRARMARWSEAWVLGFDLLRDLPVGLLAAEGEAPLGERLALATLPSVPLGLELLRREPRAPGPPELVLVAAPDPPASRGLPTFDFGVERRRRWLAPFAAERTTVLEGARASLGGLGAARALLARAEIVHFLAHGITMPEREHRAALLLSRQAPEAEQVLQAADIRALAFRGIVVLSACGSGRGPARVGDDRLASLGGAFLEAGARCVVLTRFPVEYEAAFALMERLHAELAAGIAPAEALRRAKVEVRARGGADDHASAFEVLGAGF